MHNNSLGKNIKSSLLVYSTLYPNFFQPTRGIFVKELCCALAARHPVTVVAPVDGLRNLGRLRKLNKYSAQHFSKQLRLHYPVFWVLPRIGKQFDALLMAFWSRRAFRKAIHPRPALVHAHYAYPEAVAAHILSSEFRLPLIITVHGSDINVIARDPARRYQIVNTLKKANAVVAVAKDLANKVIELGVNKNRVYHIPNGVDEKKFRPGIKAEARHRLGLAHFGRLILAVGRMEPVKNYDRLLEALTYLAPDIGLVFVGDGRERKRLEVLSGQLGLRKRVHFAGLVEHNQLAPYYQAADCLVISSSMEGWPTVIFESLACGTPVVSTPVGDIPEILSNSALGVLTRNSSANGIAEAILMAYTKRWNRPALLSAARAHTWHSIAMRYLDLYKQCL